MQEKRFIRSYTFEQYVERVRSFHGYAAPGVIIGGFMVDLAYRSLPQEGLFDVLCETPKCLPDAIQLLTPCTTGNGWLTVIDVGRFALCLYDKETGEGVRVFIDAGKIRKWPEIRNWFFKMTMKKQQDELQLLEQIREAGADICSVQFVRVADHMRKKKCTRDIVVCPNCGEAYPADDNPVCRGCRDPLYSSQDEVKSA